METLNFLKKQKAELEECRIDLVSKGFSMNFFVKEVDNKIEVIDHKIRNLVKANKPSTPLVTASVTFTELPKVKRISDTHRSRYRREAEEEVQLLKIQKKRAEDTLQRLQNDKQPFRVVELVEKTKAKIQQFTKDIKNAEQKVIDIEQGEYDEKFLDEVSENMKKEKNRCAATLEKKKKKQPSQPEKRVWKDTDDRFPSEREMDRELRYYMESFQKFPEHMKEKLSKMPNNRGFLWRGSSFYGSLPAQNPIDETILTERVPKGGSFEIHEHVFTPVAHIVYRKMPYNSNNRGRGGRRGGDTRQQISYESRIRIF